MAEDKIAEHGIWIEDTTGKVVEKQPRGGATQLVRPGGRITDVVEARIASLDADPEADPVPAHVALGNPAEVVQEDVAPAEPAKKPARKKS